MSDFILDNGIADMIPRADEKGVYLDECQITRPSKWTLDPVKAERLWRLSEDLVGENFGYGKESRL